jgi:hypothetical protein
MYPEQSVMCRPKSDDLPDPRQSPVVVGFGKAAQKEAKRGQIY